MVPGYRQIAWNAVGKGDEIYILDQNGNGGAGKAYGPYHVEDAANQLVSDPKHPYNGTWPVTEPIGVKELATPPAPTHAPIKQASGPSASAVLSAIRDWVVVDIASKASNLSAHDRMRLESEAASKLATAEQVLNEWKHGP